MTIELLQERIAHLETRRQLWNAQGQLLSLLAQQSEPEMQALQRLLADEKARAAAPPPVVAPPIPLRRSKPR